MTTRFRLADETAVETLDASEVEVLGTADGWQFVQTRDGRELQVGAEVQPWESTNPVRAGEVHIERRERYQTAGMAWPETRHWRIRATVVERGSYERAVERERAEEQAKERRANPPYMVIDALAEVRALAPKLPHLQPLGAASEIRC